MQKITQQEMILSAFIDADKLENVINDKSRKYGKDIADNQTQAILKQIEIMTKNHRDKINTAKKTMHIDSLAKKNMSRDILDALQDLIKDLINLQSFYNESLVNITNPYIRENFTLMRDDAMRYISILQQNIESLESKPNMPNSVIFSKPKGN